MPKTDKFRYICIWPVPSPRSTITDPRDTLNEVLKNLHGSLKWYWQVVMGLAMVLAVNTLFDSLFLKDSTPWEIVLPCLLFFFVFLPTFIRNYFGDSRYLDEHYIEHRKWRPIKIYVEDTSKKISVRRMFIDITLLMFKGIFFVFMARSFQHPHIVIFYSTFAALLLSDIIWLILTLWPYSPPRETSKPQSKYSAPKRWIWNNSIHLIVMVPFLIWEFLTPKTPVFTCNVNVQELVLLGICISNSFFDFALTYNYYIPEFSKELDGFLRK